MKVIKKTKIRPGTGGPRIRCSIVDTLNAVPIPIGFFFEKTLDHDTLAASLELVLRDYPMFASSFTIEKGEL
jgi:hypothetical protein